MELSLREWCFGFSQYHRDGLCLVFRAWPATVKPMSTLCVPTCGADWTGDYFADCLFA